MEYALTPNVRGQDFGTLLGAVMTNPAGTDLAWDFARRHWAEINSKPPGNTGGRILTSASVFCDAKHEEEVKDFFTQKKSDDRAIQQAVEDIGSCADVKSLQEPKLAAWFESRHPGGTLTGHQLRLECGGSGRRFPQCGLYGKRATDGGAEPVAATVFHSPGFARFRYEA